MPIAFQCPSCNKQLRVPETAVGKRAKCPGCQHVLTVPAASTISGAAPAPASPPPGPPVGLPPGPPPVSAPSNFAANPYAKAQAPQPAANPYSTPLSAATHSGQPARPLTTKEILLSFEGRIPRSIYWMWTLIAAFSVLALGLVFGLLVYLVLGETPLVMVPFLLLYIPLIYVSIAIQCKRWHDRGKSGWWILINLIPYIGGIWAFVEVGCLRGTVGPNQFGPDPLQGR